MIQINLLYTSLSINELDISNVSRLLMIFPSAVECFQAMLIPFFKYFICVRYYSFNYIHHKKYPSRQLGPCLQSKDSSQSAEQTDK